MTLCCPLALPNCRLTSFSHVLTPLCGPFNVVFVASRRSLRLPFPRLLKPILLSLFDCHLSPFTTFLSYIYRPCVAHWTSPLPFTASSSPLKLAKRFRIPVGAGFSEKYHVSHLSILWHCFDVVFNAPKWLYALRDVEMAHEWTGPVTKG